MTDEKKTNVFKDKFLVACMAIGIAFGLAVNVFPAFEQAVWTVAGVGTVLLIGVGIVGSIVAVFVILKR
jgi:hypothetical protein